MALAAPPSGVQYPLNSRSTRHRDELAVRMWKAQASQTTTCAAAVGTDMRAAQD